MGGGAQWAPARCRQEAPRARKVSTTLPWSRGDMSTAPWLPGQLVDKYLNLYQFVPDCPAQGWCLGAPFELVGILVIQDRGGVHSKELLGVGPLIMDFLGFCQKSLSSCHTDKNPWQWCHCQGFLPACRLDRDFWQNPRKSMTNGPTANNSFEWGTWIQCLAPDGGKGGFSAPAAQTGSNLARPSRLDRRVRGNQQVE